MKSQYLSIVVLCLYACTQAPQAPKERFGLYDSEDKVVGQSELWMDKDSQREQLQARVGKSELRVDIELQVREQHGRDYRAERRFDRKLDVAIVRATDQLWHWQHTHAMTRSRSEIEAPVDVVLEEPVQFGDQPSGSLLGWMQVAKARAWRLGMHATLQVLCARNGRKLPMIVEVREPTQLNLDGQAVPALRLFAWTVNSGHSLWLAQADQSVLAVSNVAGLLARREGLSLPAATRVPLPEKAREIELEVLADNVRLSGTLTEPVDVHEPMPALLLLHGSGPMDRDENGTWLRLDIFRQIAYAMAAQGFVVARYDKRGVGKSVFIDADKKSLRLEDLLADARAWVQLLAGRPEIDRKRIFVLGHSEGAYLSRALANDAAGGQVQIAGIVTIGGPAQRLDLVMLEQAQLLFAAEGADAQTLQQTARQQNALFKILRAAKFDDVEATSGKLIAGMDVVSAAWMRSHLDHDAEAELTQLRTPMLAVFGANDLQVPQLEADKLMSLLTPAQCSQTSVAVLADLDHLMMESAQLPGTGRYADPDRRVDAQAMTTIVNWLTSTARGARSATSMPAP